MRPVIACGCHITLNNESTSMEEQPTFLLRFPCFAIHNTTGVGPAVQTFNRAGVAMVLLSDEDLLTRFRAEYGAGGSAVRFNDIRQLVVYLSMLPPVVTEVVIDPGPRSAIALPVETVIQQCCRQVERRPSART